MTRTLKRNMHNNESFTDSVEKIGEDLTQIKDDLARTANDVADAALDGVATAKKAARRSVREARKRGGETIEALADNIGDHPWTAIAIAAGAGLLIGMFACRKD